MENESKILLQIHSNKIVRAEQCKNCKCFKIETDSKKDLKYHCIVKEGDSFCDFVQKVLNKIMVVENIKAPLTADNAEKIRDE
ncbi:MAG: hypothetical protein Ta2F_13890 [Termitinemataceae bacterium]|nr:MAG: hypothetical protein Ta2F_13890 [Termitinemataceae bacterium]